MLNFIKTKTKIKPEYLIVAILIALAIVIPSLNFSKSKQTNLTSTENFILQTEKQILHKNKSFEK